MVIHESPNPNPSKSPLDRSPFPTPPPSDSLLVSRDFACDVVTTPTPLFFFFPLFSLTLPATCRPSFHHASIHEEEKGG